MKLKITISSSNQYGNETRITSSYTVNVSNALKQEVYDENDSTYITLSRIESESPFVTQPYMIVDQSMWNKKIVIKTNNYVSATLYVCYYDNNNNSLNNDMVGTSSSTGYVYSLVPQNTYRITIVKLRANNTINIYEVRLNT